MFQPDLPQAGGNTSRMQTSSWLAGFFHRIIYVSQGSYSRLGGETLPVRLSQQVPADLSSMFSAGPQLYNFKGTIVQNNNKSYFHFFHFLCFLRFLTMAVPGHNTLCPKIFGKLKILLQFSEKKNL
jgi:hypothetical protein